MSRALVLSSETASAVAVVRSLHRQGLEVAALALRSTSPAALSWRCGLTHVVSSHTSAELPKLVRELAPDVVVPVTEADLLRVARVRAELESIAPVVMHGAEALAQALDKGRMAQLAASAGVNVPAELRVSGEVESGLRPPGGYPAVAKPAASRSLDDDGDAWAGTAEYVADEAALVRVVAAHAAAGLDTLVQSVVRGEARLVSLLLAHDGSPRLVFVHRRVRQMRPEGGPSACAESVTPDPRLVEPAVAAARAAGLVGAPVQLEFKVPDGGPPVLLDVNPRPWGSLGLAYACGIDFHGIAARHVLGEPLPADPPPYPVGLRVSYLPFELRRAAAVWFGEPRPGYDGPWPSRTEALLDLLSGLGRGLVLKLDDPLPAVGDLLAWARRARGRN